MENEKATSHASQPLTEQIVKPPAVQIANAAIDGAAAIARSVIVGTTEGMAMVANVGKPAIKLAEKVRKAAPRSHQKGYGQKGIGKENSGEESVLPQGSGQKTKAGPEKGNSKTRSGKEEREENFKKDGQEADEEIEALKSGFLPARRTDPCWWPGIA